MIAECAVEPEVMAEWRHFDGLHADFGVGNGRLLCEFPGKWRKRVLETVRRYEQEGRNSPIQAQRIIDHFQHGAFRRAMVASGREYPGEGSWCEAARAVSEPFDLIIHSQAPSSERELRAGDFLRGMPPFARPRQTEVKRVATELIAAGWPCFRKAREFLIVDPYFRPREAKFGRVLGHFLARLEREAAKPRRLEVHTQLPEPYDAGVQSGNWKHWAGEHLPSNWELSIFHWTSLETGGQLHARYVLTDLGGLDYNWGTDEDPNEWTQVALLDDPFWERLYRRFGNKDSFGANPGRIITVTG